MTTLVIQDLNESKTLDSKTMLAVLGGGHGYGNYSHIHYGSWVTTNFHRHFLRYVRRFGRYYRVYQYHKTQRQVNYKHTGWIGF